MYGGIELDGRYRVEDRLGGGGMGEVWRSADLKLNRSVAVKILPIHHARSARRMELFQREVEITAALQHPGITVVHDVGEHEGLLFFVMEHIDGEDLTRVLDRNPDGLPVDRASDIGFQAAEALAAAHRRGVVHRDVKPANIMITTDGRVKICDFGVARVLQDIRGENGTAGIGTAAYMAPEQFDGTFGERSDLYSLGCVLYELITGAPPFRGTPYELMNRHRSTIPLSLVEFDHAVPAGLDALVMSLLEKRPEDRPSRAEEVRERLAVFRHVRSDTAGGTWVRTVPGDVAVHVPPLLTETPHEKPSLRLLASGTPPKKHTPHNERVAATVQKVLSAKRVEVRVSGCTRGPTVSRYEIRISSPAEAERVAELVVPISSALGGSDVVFLPSIPSSSPLPGGTAVGLEIPNADPDVIGLGDVLRSEFATHDDSPLTVGLGRSGSGPVLVDLAESPHLLLAGSSGSGKTMAIRAAVTSILARSTPDRARLILVDSRGGGLSEFEGIPHLLFPVVTDPGQAVAALRWAEEEMERRYDDLASHGYRTTAAYNVAVRDGLSPPPVRCLGGATPHPSIAIFVDELAELINRAGRDVERLISGLTRLARAVGIHLVVATRETDPRFLTDRIRADIPSRLAFRTSSAESGEVVIDQSGTERLQVPGDALFLSKGADSPIRLRCPLVSNREIAAVVEHWVRQKRSTDR